MAASFLIHPFIPSLLSVWPRQLRKHGPVVSVHVGVERVAGLRASITHGCVLRHRFRRVEICMLDLSHFTTFLV